MNSKRFGYIIIISVLSTFLVIGSATARTIMSYNTAYAAGVNASSSATATSQINPYTSAMILLQDGISALQQDNDTSKALMHLKLAYQQLSSVGENSSIVQPTKTLLQDGISALQQDNDSSKTLVYMKLAYQQLSSPSNTASLPSSSASSAVGNHIGPSVTHNASAVPVSSLPSSSSSSHIRSKIKMSSSINSYDIKIPTTRPIAGALDDASHCNKTGYPSCYSIGYAYGVSDGGKGIGDGTCPKGHSGEFCSGYGNGWSDSTQGGKPAPVDKKSIASDNYGEGYSAGLGGGKSYAQAGEDLDVSEVGDICRTHSAEWCRGFHDGYGKGYHNVNHVLPSVPSQQPQPTPSPLSTVTAESPYCDKPGYPSCKSLGETAGEKAQNVPCPSGHSKEYCKGWNKTACSSEGCGGDYTCDNPHQPKGATGCPNDKLRTGLAQVQPTSSQDCIDNPAIGMSCQRSQTTAATLPIPQQGVADTATPPTTPDSGNDATTPPTTPDSGNDATPDTIGSSDSGSGGSSDSGGSDSGGHGSSDSGGGDHGSSANGGGGDSGGGGGDSGGDSGN